MGKTQVIDINQTAAQIETIINATEQSEWDTFKENVFITIPESGPDSGRLVLCNIPGTSAPKGSAKVAVFNISLNSDQVAGELAKIETAQNLETRFYGKTLVAGQLQWLAVLDPKTIDGKFLRLDGQISTFGGPNDKDMGEMEDTAFVWDKKSEEDYPGFFASYDPRKPTGYGHRLNTDKHYIACRWEELDTPLPRKYLRQPTTLCTVINPETGDEVNDVRPIDFGPAKKLHRVADLSPSVASACNLRTDQVAIILIPRPSATNAVIPNDELAPKGTRKVVWLTGSYAQRKRLAGNMGCTYTVDFHFNSAGVLAYGPEVYYKTNDDKAKALAQDILDSILALGLENKRAENLQAAGGKNAGYIDGYPCHSVLIEPLFIYPDPEQSAWIKNEQNLKSLAKHVAQAIFAKTDETDLIGLSIGHLGNTAKPGDQGAEAWGGGWETDYSEPMARIVYETLTGIPA